MKGLSALLVCLLLLLPCGQVLAIPAIWKLGNTVPVRSTVANVAPSKAQYVQNSLAAANDGSVISTATMPFKIGETTVSAALQKTVAANDIAVAAAGALLSGSALGLLATLALPYVIDQATDAFYKQVPGELTEPLTTSQVQFAGDSYGTCYAKWDSNPSLRLVGDFTYTGCVTQINNLISQGRYNGAMSFTVAGVTVTTLTASKINSTWTSNEPSAPHCTSPSYYDNALDMCVGSAINEPANAEQLAADIAETFGQNPAKAIDVLDGLNSSGYSVPIPASDPVVEGVSPNTLSGSPTTTVRDYFDPATNHPVRETTQEQPSYDIEPSPQGDGVDVSKRVTTTRTVEDQVTGGSVVTSEESLQTPSPSEPAEQADPCVQNPESIGCSTYGDIPPADTIPTTNVDISLSPSSWGEGSCPADVTLGGHFGNGITYTYAPVCQFLSSLAPVLIVVGWLIAGGIVVGGVRD